MTTQEAGSTDRNLNSNARHRVVPGVIATGDPDPYKRDGVPDRLVLVLHRDGPDYVGSLSIWEYRALRVVRSAGPDSDGHLTTEMVVDVSYPTRQEITVLGGDEPTPWGLVHELVGVLDDLVNHLP